MVIGKHVMLRPVTSEDAPLLADWLSDPGYMGSFLDVWPVTREQWEKTLSEWSVARDGCMLLGLERESGAPVGLVGYFNPFTRQDLFQGLEIWAQVHPDFRRRGLALEGGLMLLQHMFEAHPIERIQATVALGNVPSCRVAEALGMKREGICRGLIRLHGRQVDAYMYSIVRDDWRAPGL